MKYENKHSRKASKNQGQNLTCLMQKWSLSIKKDSIAINNKHKIEYNSVV